MNKLPWIIIAILAIVICGILLGTTTYQWGIQDGTYRALGDKMCANYSLGKINNGYCDLSDFKNNYTLEKFESKMYDVFNSLPIKKPQ